MANGGAKGADKLTSVIMVYAPPELKYLAGEAADQMGVPLSEYVVRILAKELRRADLARIPRKSVGRPRKHLEFEAAHGNGHKKKVRTTA